jgi:hypothetical protein
VFLLNIKLLSVQDPGVLQRINLTSCRSDSFFVHFLEVRGSSVFPCFPFDNSPLNWTLSSYCYFISH